MCLYPEKLLPNPLLRDSFCHCCSLSSLSLANVYTRTHMVVEASLLLLRLREQQERGLALLCSLSSLTTTAHQPYHPTYLPTKEDFLRCVKMLLEASKARKGGEVSLRGPYWKTSPLCHWQWNADLCHATRTWRYSMGRGRKTRC